VKKLPRGKLDCERFAETFSQFSQALWKSQKSTELPKDLCVSEPDKVMTLFRLWLMDTREQDMHSDARLDRAHERERYHGF
jgi:hypothetical protein